MIFCQVFLSVERFIWVAFHGRQLKKQKGLPLSRGFPDVSVVTENPCTFEFPLNRLAQRKIPTDLQKLENLMEVSLIFRGVGGFFRSMTVAALINWFFCIKQSYLVLFRSPEPVSFSLGWIILDPATVFLVKLSVL